MIGNLQTNTMSAQTELAGNPKIYTGTAARVLKLMSAGCNQIQAAQAVGVTESYVSQLCAEEDFQLQLAQALKTGIERCIEIDENYGEVEKLLSARMKTLLPYVTSIDQVVRLLKFTNEAKRKTQQLIPTNGTVHGVNGSGPVVNAVKLVLPPVITNIFITNPNNEVVAVDNRELVTLDSQSIGSFVASKRAIPKLPSSVQNESSKDKWGDL